MTIHPYTLDELKAVISQHAMDIYHRELMKWAVEEIEDLKKKLG